MVDFGQTKPRILHRKCMNHSRRHVPAAQIIGNQFMSEVNHCHDNAMQTPRNSDCLYLSKKLPADTLALSIGANAQHPEVDMVTMKGQMRASEERCNTGQCLTALRQQDTLIPRSDNLSDLIGIRPLTAEKIRLGCPTNLG